MFAKLDKDGASRGDTAAAADTRHLGSQPPPLCLRVAAGNGRLTFDEFVSAAMNYGARSRLSDMMALQKSRASLKALFDALDVDGNGEIDSKEWGRAVSTHAETMSKLSAAHTRTSRPGAAAPCRPLPR